MSGAPNVEQIRKLRSLLLGRAHEMRRFEEATQEIADWKARAESSATAAASLEAEIGKLLTDMDCEPNVNFGSERRMVMLLTGLCSLDR